MPPPSPANPRTAEWLMTAVVLLVAVLFVRLCLMLPKFWQLFQAIDGLALPRLSRLLLPNSLPLMACGLLVAVATVFCAWSRRRWSGIGAAIGLAVLGLSTFVIWDAAVGPLLRVITTMSGE
jgi:hypothetical protein